MNYTVVINSAVWAGALAYYYIDARKWFTGPKITINTDDLTETQAQALREEGLDVEGVEYKVNEGGAETSLGQVDEKDIEIKSKGIA